MASPNGKKRKYEDENRNFKPEWEEDFAFTVKGSKPLCLICNSSLSHYKASNLKRHYETNHPNFSWDYPPKSELRTNMLSMLKASLNSQATLSATFSKEADTATEASFVISWNIARAKCPYSDGEFIKKNIAEVVAVLDPENTKLQRLIAQTAVSRHTIERRISQVSADVAGKMQDDLKASLAFSLAIDQSTDIQDNPQLAVFVRYVSSGVTVKEEMLDLVALKETTRGVDIKNALDRALKKAEIPLDKLVSVATDGAPAVVGENAGLIALMKSDPSFPEFLPVHSIIHCEHLASRYFKYEEVMKSVLEIVNFIRSSGKTHPQFKNFIEELELEDKPSDVSSHCNMRWLSTSNVLSRFVDLLEPIISFLEEKKRFCPQLVNDEWMQDLMFLTDVMNHLQILILELQGKDKIVSDFTETIFGFQNKIRVFQRDILSRHFIYFPHLKRRVNTFPNIEIKDHKLEEYKDKLQGLLDDFLDRFKDLQKLKPCFTFLVNPFMVDVINDGCPVPKPLVTESSAVEMELIDLQEDLGLKMAHKSLSTIEFWRQVPEIKYPELKKTSVRLISVFSTTYCCESLYSIMKFVKSKHRAILSNQHLMELIRTALTTYQPDFKRLTAKMETHSISLSSNYL